MNELVIIVEGETEQTFVRDQLAGHLLIYGTRAWAVLPGRNRRQGGVKRWAVAIEDIQRTLKERRFCTTMMDYYAMPVDWPGRTDAKSMPWDQRASHVENQMKIEVAKAMGGKFNPKYFIPYIQLHEFEALAFADVKRLTEVVAPLSKISTAKIEELFAGILASAKNPEAINDSYETCPSRRITGVVPAYKKRAQGPIVTSRIGLDVLRQECTHFGYWLAMLEKLNESG